MNGDQPRNCHAAGAKQPAHSSGSECSDGDKEDAQSNIDDTDEFAMDEHVDPIGNQINGNSLKLMALRQRGSDPDETL